MLRPLVQPTARPRRAATATRIQLTLLAVGLLTLLGGCATPPLETEEARRDPGPAEVSATSEGEVFLWGGLLIDVARREDGGTRLEILALPLDRAGRPRDDGRPRGRFLAVSQESHDPAEFRSGRRILVRGRLTGFKEGRIGESVYRYPQLDCDALHLWGADGRSPGSSWHFGIGLGIGL